MQSVTSTLSSYSPTRFVSGKHAAVGQTGIWALENARRRPSSYDTRRARIMYNLDGDGNISEEPVDHTGSKVTASKRAKAALEQQQNGEVPPNVRLVYNAYFRLLVRRKRPRLSRSLTSSHKQDHKLQWPMRHQQSQNRLLLPSCSENNRQQSRGQSLAKQRAGIAASHR
jgi:hypothetical protein